MIIKQCKIDKDGGGNVFVPFEELEKLAKQDWDSVMYKSFVHKIDEKRSISVERANLWDAPAPMMTWCVSDEAMKRVADCTAYGLEDYDDYDEDNLENEFDWIMSYDRANEAFWRNEEEALNDLGVPYFEDSKVSDFQVSDKVFVFTKIRKKELCGYGAVTEVDAGKGIKSYIVVKFDHEPEPVKIPYDYIGMVIKEY